MGNNNQKRQRAVTIEFKIKEFKEEFDEILKKRMKFKDINKTIHNLGIAIILYYIGEEPYAKQAPCNIMLSNSVSKIEDCINYDSYEVEDVAGQITSHVQEMISGIRREDIKYKEIKYGGNTEFSGDVLILFGVYSSTDESTGSKCQIFKKLILEFLEQTINNMSDFIKYSQKNDTFWEDITYNFIERYKEIVFSEYNIPAIKLVESVSRSPYEKRECRGNVIFADSEELNTNIIKIDESYEWSFKDTRFVRKMLEIATGECYLVVQVKEKKYRIEGFCPKITSEDLQKKVYISFSGNCSYSVFSKGEEILRCENGIYYPTKEDVEININEICSEFQNLPGLKSILENWNKIEHGAIFIFAEDAKEICKNLCRKYKRGTIVEAFKLEEEADFFISLSAVDGAVLADMDGNCYAYALILDGEAKVEADLTRGSRYNSAINYVHNKQRIAVVISEDKEREPDILPEWK